MKKRVISAILCLGMLVCLLSTAAFAASLPFTDVKTSAWYYDDVKTAYEGNLINGKDATTFDPGSYLTYGETVKLAACMHQKSMTGAVTLKNGSPWYQSYVDYCKLNGIISKDYDWKANASRAGYMEIFANALPDYSLKAINTVDDGAIPDVSMKHPQAAAIYKLYRAGILQGNDAKHSCNPGTNIKRSEVASILTRMMNADKRISFSMTDDTLKIVTQPEDVVAALGETAEFKVVVTGGKAPYTYTWQANTSGIWGYLRLTDDIQPSGDTLTVRAKESLADVLFRCIIKDADGNTVTSDEVQLVLTTAKLTITQQPQDVTIKSGENAVFTVAVSGGVKPYTYQWYCNGSAITHAPYGAMTPTLSVPNQFYEEDDFYFCVITDNAGQSVTTKNVYVELTPLTITQQPQDAETGEGGQVTLTVAVTGGIAPYTYTWQSLSQGQWRELYNTEDCSISGNTIKIIARSHYWSVNEPIHCIIRDATGTTVTSNAAEVIIGEQE